MIIPSEIFKRMRENLENHSIKINSDGKPQNDKDVTTANDLPPITEEYEQPITDKPYDTHPPLKAENSIPSEPASNNPLDTPEKGGLVAFAAGEPKIMEQNPNSSMSFGAGPGNAGSYQSSDTKTPYGTVGTRKKVGGMTDQ